MFVQQATSAPGDIFETAAPTIGSDPPKARDITDGDASVATQTGALQYSYPVRLPAGRNGMAPTVALGYSSQAPIYGTIAAGWSMSIPEIREDTSQGRLATHSLFYEASQSDPKADDRFTSTLAGGRPLVKVTEAIGVDVYSSYRAQNDTSFARYERMLAGQPFKWRVRQSDGSTMYFGEPVRTVGCNNISEGYAPLTRVEDVFGNSIFYEWESVTLSECRIKQITWGRNAIALMNQPFAKVAFEWLPGVRCLESEGSYIGAQLDYRTGTKILTGASKLVAIRATAFPFGGDAAPTHTRLITLGYSPTSESCQTAHAPVRLLTSIQESAWGANIPQVNLPAVTFQYGTPIVNLNTQTGVADQPPWNDTTGVPAKKYNLGWGSRAPSSATDKWPTVEAMMVDLDGDGLLDRAVNSSTVGTCRLDWQRNSGPVEGSSSTRPGFEGARSLVLPRLPWRGSATPIPFGGASTPDPITYFEGCALNGQVTAYRNVLNGSAVKCHDGVSEPITGGGCQFNPLLSDYFCYTNGEFGLECPNTGLGGDYRTYLAYRWLDADGDGLTDLVTAVHGNIDAFDIVEGNDSDIDGGGPDTGQPVVPEPFGPWPACPTDMDRCLSIDRFCMDSATSQSQINNCIANASEKPCGALVVSPFMAPGAPSPPPYVREPYTRCEGLHPWMIYKNQGNGVLASSPVIKYSPVPLESDTGDSALSGPTISSTGHGVFDFDGDGRVDAVKLDQQGNNWQVWRGDGTGGFDPRVHVIHNLTHPWRAISSIGVPSFYPSSMATAQGTFDLNGDGLADRWFRVTGGNASVAWHNGTTFDTVEIPGTSPKEYGGTVTTPIVGSLPLKPGNDTKFTALFPLDLTGRVEGGDTYAQNRLADVDHDGRVDIVDIAQPALSPVNVYFNAGGNFAPFASPYNGNSSGVIRRVTALKPSEDSLKPWQLTADLIDLDGDGLMESALFNASSQLERHEHAPNGAPPRVLTTINNGRGTTSTIAYASMHDKSAVTQRPNEYWFDGRRKVSPHNQWVVKSLTTADAFAGTTSTATQQYNNPRHGADDEGRYAFRGFEEVWTNMPSGSQTIERFDYAVDWSGRLTESRVHPAQTAAPSTSEVRTMDRTTWTPRMLFSGAVTTYHAVIREQFTCANAQTPTTCTATAAPAYTKTVLAQSSFAGAGGVLTLWQDTETILQAGTILANGDRRTVETFQLKSETDMYRFRPLESVREHRVAGAWTMFGKTAKTWDTDLRVALTDEVWFDSVDGNRAITRFVHDMDTGNLIQRYKPIQNAANTTSTSFGYDDRKLYAASETNELGHVRNYTFEYGTGTKIKTTGPNASGCGGVCPPNAPPGSICLPTEQYETKIDGFGRSLEQWDTVSDDGCTYFYHQRSTTSYVDTVSVPTTPSSVTERTRIDSNAPTWTEKRTDIDGLGRPLKETVFVQGSAPADQVTTFAYSSAATLTAVEVPDPSANSSARVQYVYTYDTLKRPLTIRRPDSTTTPSGVNIVYDGVTKTTTEVVGASGGNAAGTKTITDRFGRLAQVQEQTAASTWQTTTYTYGPDDLVTSIVDPQSVTTSLVHDFAGNRTQITRGTRNWKYTYNKNGNLATEQVPGSTGPADDINYTTSIAYDDLDRPLQRLVGQRTLSSADQTLFGGNVENFYYDTLGNMRGKLYAWEALKPGGAEAAASETFRETTQGQRFFTSNQLRIAGYAPLERTFYQTFYLFGGTRTTYYYDQVGAGTQYTQSQVFYDARALPSSLQVTTPTSNSNVGVQTRNVAGLVTKRRSTLVAGGTNYIESNWTYDKLGRVTSQIVTKGPTASQVARQNLAYFGNDNPKQVNHILVLDSKAINYTYDWRHQLLTAISTTTGYFSGTYTYGNAGRLASANESQTINPLPAGTEVKPRNVNYVYSGTDPEQVTALTNVSGGATYASFTYDAAGNMTAKCTGGQVATCTGAGMEKLEYVYDGSDQLRRVTRKFAGSITGSEEYWYGMAGNRISIVKRDAAGAKTEMIWFIGDTQAHYNATGTVTHVYSNISLGTPVARVDRTADTVTSTEYQFHGLANGTLATVAANGTINASFRYSPWGAVLESTDAGGSSNGTAAHRRRHNDKYVDEVSTLAYYGARYYDKTLIGWTQSDPLFRFAPDAAWTAPRHALLYTFSLNNSLRYVDPDGLESLRSVMGGGCRSAQCNNGNPVVGGGEDKLDVDWEMVATIATTVPRTAVGFFLKLDDGGCTNGGCSPPGADPPSGSPLPLDRGTGTVSTQKDKSTTAATTAVAAPDPKIRVNLAPKPEPKPAQDRVRGDKMKEETGLNQALEQAGGLTKAQQAARKKGAGDATINDTKKTDQNVQNRLNRVKSKDDIDPEDID